MQLGFFTPIPDQRKNEKMRVITVHSPWKIDVIYRFKLVTVVSFGARTYKKIIVEKVVLKYSCYLVKLYINRIIFRYLLEWYK